MNTLSILRDHSLANLLGDAFAVIDEDGLRRLGTIVKIPPRMTGEATIYRVLDAGPGVQVDPQARYDSAAQAADAILALRAGSPALVVDHTGLTALQRDILDLEGLFFFRLRRSKADAIAVLFNDLTQMRYQQVLNHLIDQPAALAYSPIVVNRLRRQRSESREARSVRNLRSNHA